MNFFYLDFETRSRVDLKKVGARNYAADHTTEVISIACAKNDEPVCHFPTSNVPWWASDFTFVAHNIEFEQAILKYKYKFEHPLWLDTMALAAQMSLPLNLKELAAFFGFAKGDTRAVQKLSKPRRKSKANPGGDLFWEREDVPDDFEELDEYNKNDVEVMRQCHQRMMSLTPKEQRIWQLTQMMNERGVRVDMPALSIAIPQLATERNALTAKFVASTGCSPRSPVKLAKFFGLPDAKAQTIEKALKDSTLTTSVQNLLKLRKTLGKSSASKLMALQLRTSLDGLLRGSLVYGGASRTGRWSSKGVQLQNLTRGLGLLTDDAFTMLHTGRLKSLIELAPDMVRGFFVGPFLIGDYSQIEARILAWLADDKSQMAEWASGVDLYRRMAARIYSKPESEVTEHERFIGKNTVLGCGYGMGGKVREGRISKFQSQLADKFGVNVTSALAELAVSTYRQVYSPVVQLWSELEKGFRQALSTRSGQSVVRGIGFERRSVGGVRYLLVVLPSGRRLYYAHPLSTDTGELRVFSPRREYGQGAGQDKLYGGKLVENIVQATARDLMAEHMLEMEEQEFTVRLTVHDEIVADDDGRLDRFKAVMQRTPQWAQGLPLAVEVFQAQRYRK